MMLKRIDKTEIPMKITHFIKNFKRRYYRYYTLVKFASKVIYRNHYIKRTNILKEKWDYLIILDACRYDAFSYVLREMNLNNYNVELTYIYSVGSDTVEFLNNTFKNIYRDDIIYVTANPYVDVYVQGKVFKIVSVWKERWDSELNTVHPKDVYELALRYAYFYPNKRIIIHFIQPHYPFLIYKGLEDTGLFYHKLAALGAIGKSDVTVWDLFFDGTITLRDIIRGYMYNLKLVMKYVLRLIDKLSGTIIVTADHGEGFGEPLNIASINIGIYGHIPGIHHESLIKVPWLVIKKHVELKRRIRGIDLVRTMVRSSRTLLLDQKANLEVMM